MTEFNQYTTEIKSNFKRIIPYIVIITLLLLVIAQCNDSITTKYRTQKNEKIANDSVKYFKNKIGTLTATIGTYEMTQKEFESKILSQDQELKKITGEFYKLKQVLKFTAVANIDTIYIPFEKSIVFDSISKTKISSFERKGSYSKEWFNFNYNINNSGIKVTDIYASIDITAVTGFKKKWFLGRSYAVTDITSKNPNITITNVQSTEIVVPKKFYETNAFLIGVGFALRSILPIN